MAYSHSMEPHDENFDTLISAGATAMSSNRNVHVLDLAAGRRDGKPGCFENLQMKFDGFTDAGLGFCHSGAGCYASRQIWNIGCEV
jgi:hypothetical protein